MSLSQLSIKMTATRKFFLTWVFCLAVFPLFAQESIEALLIPFREVRLGFSKPGKVSEMKVKEGDRVKEGQLLAELENNEEELRLRQHAKVVERRSFDESGSKKLFDKNMISEDEYLEKRIERDLALIEKERSEAELAKTKLIAPFDGIIVKQEVREAEWVEPGSPVFVLLDESTYFAEALVSPELSKKLKIGMELHLYHPDLNKPKTCKVDFIDPRVDPSSNLVRVKMLVVVGDSSLRTGLTTEIRLPPL